MRVAAAITAFLIPAAANASVTYSVPGQFSSIQAAIDAVPPGGTVVVHPGVYHEKIDLRGKPFTLTGTAPEDPQVVQATIVDATDLEASVIVANSGELLTTRVLGLTLTGGTGTYRHGFPRGGGAYIRLSSPFFSHCRFIGNIADAGGGVALEVSNARFEHCEFIGNTAEGFGPNRGGGAVNIRDIADVSLIGCRFVLNNGISGSQGGAVAVWAQSTVNIVNGLFERNRGLQGGGLYVDSSTAHVINCTAVDNVATLDGGFLMLFQYSGKCYVRNGIFWGNEALSNNEEFTIFSGSTFEMSHSLVDHDSEASGPFVVPVTDPGFIDYEGGDYALRTDSIAVDFGGNAFVPVGVDVDLVGGTRIMWEVVDLGAFERQDPNSGPPISCEGDFNGDGVVGFDDLLKVLGAWGACAGCPEDLSGNGLAGFEDILLLVELWGDC